MSAGGDLILRPVTEVLDVPVTAFLVFDLDLLLDLSCMTSKVLPSSNLTLLILGDLLLIGLLGT